MAVFSVCSFLSPSPFISLIHRDLIEPLSIHSLKPYAISNRLLSVKVEINFSRWTCSLNAASLNHIIALERLSLSAPLSLSLSFSRFHPLIDIPLWLLRFVYAQNTFIFCNLLNEKLVHVLALSAFQFFIVLQQLWLSIFRVYRWVAENKNPVPESVLQECRDPQKCNTIFE